VSARTRTLQRPARLVAVDALVRVEQGAYANLVVPTMLRATDLSARDRAFVTALVYGTVRRQRALDHLLAGIVDRALEALDPPVRAALRLGVAQLVDGVPAHAAVSATVDAVARRAPHARGFVNAVLRRATTLGPPWPWPEGDDTEAIGIRTSHPDWIVERFVADLGLSDARAVLDNDNVPPSVTLRPNPKWIAADALADDLRAEGIDVTRGALVPDALVVSGIGDPAALGAVVDGCATPQDQASQAVVAALDPQPGDRVLDVAAGPGGKAGAIAERVGDGGFVVALDLHPARARLVRDAARRLGLPSLRSLAADARDLPLAPQARFDRVLVDAPCSGLGVLRRRPEARFRIQPDDVDELAALQRELVRAAATSLRPGATLVYSVCTLTRAETLDVDEWIAAELPELVAQPPPPSPFRPWGRGGLLLPQAAGTDGMFVLVTRLVGSVGSGA
jgi:16S rRNA (cytosine967-C5)-methyltransferase